MSVVVQLKPRKQIARKPAIEPKQWGYRVVYPGDRINHCPGCDRSQWHIGRFSAECAFCGTAIPLAR